MLDPKSVQTTRNDPRTAGDSDTNVTRPCSGFDLTHEDDRRTLHRARNRVTADSPDGHTYSNILELRENWEKSEPGDFCQQHIPRLMKVQEEWLAVR